MGLPVITSANVPVPDESGAASSNAPLDPSQISIADDGESAISAASYATLQMETDPQTGATEQVSLWQNGLTALRTERKVNLKRRHPGIAATPTHVTFYGGDMKLFDIEPLRKEFDVAIAAAAGKPLPNQIADAVLIMVKHATRHISRSVYLVAEATGINRPASR